MGKPLFIYYKATSYVHDKHALKKTLTEKEFY